MWTDSFFKNADLDRVRPVIDEAFTKLADHLRAGGTVVLPAGGIGTGLAELPKRAPAIHAYITAQIELMRNVQPSEHPAPASPR
jgi:hypothetical protein